MGSEISAACCCNPTPFLCEDYCACVPQQVDLSIVIQFEHEQRYMGDPTKLLSRTSVLLTATNVRLVQLEGSPCTMQSVEDIGTVAHSIYSHCGSGAPNYALRTGGVGPTTACEASQCYSTCKAVYPCFTETIETSHPAKAFSVTLSCYDPCRMSFPGLPNGFCDPEGYPYLEIETSGAPSTVTKTFHCPWNLNANCAACQPNFCCCPQEQFETDPLVGYSTGVWGKKSCLGFDSFSAGNVFGGPGGLGSLPVPSVCPGPDGRPIPWTSAPPNGLYNAYTCTPGSCAFGSQAQPTTVPNRPANYTAATACVICTTPNQAPDVHACWEYTLVNGNLRYQNLQKCNCVDPPTYLTPTGFSSISNHCDPTAGPGINGGWPPWPVANPGDAYEPIAQPDTDGCGCITYWYKQTVQVTIHNIVP